MQRGLLRGALRVAARRYPLLSGGASLVQRQPFRRLTPSDPVCVATLRDGGHLYVKSHDFIGRSILLTGDYDPKLTWLCRKVLRPGDAMIDVGANHGIVTAYAARMVGPSGAVHAFEPQQELAGLLSAAMALNDYRHVTVHRVALSDTNSEMPLFGSPSSSATASLHPHGDDQSILEWVPVRRGDEILASLGLSEIRLLKLDIEGNEEAFLRGSLPYLRENRPHVVAFESHGQTPFRTRPVVSMLHDLGYVFYQVPKALFAMKLIAVEGNDTRRGFDFVAILPATGLSATLA